MSPECTSDLARCSEPDSQYLSHGGVANLQGAAASPVFIIRVFFIAALFLLASAVDSDAEVRVTGMKGWLAEAASRSLEAVCSHIPKDTPASTREKLLNIVAGRLLTGYSVESVTFESEDSVLVALAPTSRAPDWGVSIIPPNLSRPANEWFSSDVTGLAEALASEMHGVPIEALSWGDVELRRLVEAECEKRLPGWRASVMVRGKSGAQTDLEISFTPMQPLTLAVTSDINSTTIPLAIYSKFRGDLLKGFAPVIGVPAAWLELHSEDLVSLTKEILMDKSLVKDGKIDIQVKASVSSLSQMDIDLESKRYIASIWMAVYSGSRSRYPESGFHLGRRIQLLPGWDMELYTEQIVELSGWDVESRFGIRWTPWKYIWLGGEWSSKESLWWARLSVEQRRGKPYAWLRYSSENDFNGAAGYKINDYISIEAHYDSRDKEEWNIRTLVNF